MAGNVWLDLTWLDSLHLGTFWTLNTFCCCCCCWLVHNSAASALYIFLKSCLPGFITLLSFQFQFCCRIIPVLMWQVHIWCFLVFCLVCSLIFCFHFLTLRNLKKILKNSSQRVIMTLRNLGPVGTLLLPPECKLAEQNWCTWHGKVDVLHIHTKFHLDEMSGSWDTKIAFIAHIYWPCDLDKGQRSETMV